MRAGRLRDRLSLQKRDEVRDDLGGITHDWVEVTKVWAEVRGVSGRAFLSASAEQGEVTVEVLMRYRPGVEALMRFVHLPPGGNGEIYTIQAPLPDAKRRELLCMCSTGVRK